MFKKIAVIGSGTMEAGIARNIANAGHEILLLDLPGKGGDDANVISASAQERLIKSEPPVSMHKDASRLIEVDNTHDDFGKLADADWIVEALMYQREQQAIVDLAKNTANACAYSVLATPRYCDT